jgi:DNA gyrase subunit A
MNIERPDLTHLDPAIRAYIEALEAELDRVQGKKDQTERNELPLEPDEPPTTFNVITLSRSGLIKRTPRHNYSRQRRGGMGIFDLETPDAAQDPPVALFVADLSQTLLVVTNQARVFHLPVDRLVEAPIRSRGEAIAEWLRLNPSERPVLLLLKQNTGYLLLVTATGQVRRLRHHIFKETMEPGKLLFDPKELGAPAAACWSDGEDDIFIATQQGRAIRFAEQQIPVRGCLGIRLTEGDTVVAVTPVQADSGVFLLSADGKGIIRHMTGFSANKAPGSGGKTALKTERLITAFTLEANDDLFVISHLSKIIRFQAAEVSTTEGVVQGVNCITLRADEAVAAINSPVRKMDASYRR